jgi:hypothetical protein
VRGGDHVLPASLTAALNEAYIPAGMQVTSAPVRERESTAYGACRFALDGYQIVFREANTTPSKVGQFVTLWKRPDAGAPIAPLDSTDRIDFVVVAVSCPPHRGQFIFDRGALMTRGVLSRNGRGGKRAFRIYPPWSTPISSEAIRAQQWQLKHFLPLPVQGEIDAVRVRQRFNPTHSHT